MVKMGRVTPSFRRLLIAEIERLYKRYRPSLRDPKLQEAFDSLIREWSRERPAMIQSNLPYPLDAMNLLANVHVRAEIERFEKKLKELQEQASDLKGTEGGEAG
jgi:hypothetical protein